MALFHVAVFSVSERKDELNHEVRRIAAVTFAASWTFRR